MPDDRVILTRSYLDSMHCASPGCDHTAHDGLILSSRCHPRTPTWAKYSNGVLQVTCSLCHKVVANIAVAGDVH